MISHNYNDIMFVIPYIHICVSLGMTPVGKCPDYTIYLVTLKYQFLTKSPMTFYIYLKNLNH